MLTPSSLRILDLGRMPYAGCLAMQREIHAQVVADELPQTVLLVEHDPVITISRRKTATQHLLASRDQLAKLGIDVQETDRGGDVTYHGPGQLVAYPIIRFAPLQLNVSRYMRLLEQIITDAIAPFGITGERDECATGVWVNLNAMHNGAGADESELLRKHERKLQQRDEREQHVDADPTLPQPLPQRKGSQTCHIKSTAKIAALGVRLSRNVSMHGLALNVTTNLSHFNTIVPCGLLNRSVTSMQQLLGDSTPTMEQVKASLSLALERHLSPPPLSEMDSAQWVPRTTPE